MNFFKSENNYQQDQVLANRLQDKLKRQLEIENKPIYINDMILYNFHGEDYSHGEAKKNNNKYKDSEPSLTRLLDHISLLMRLANRSHQLNYCEKSNTEGLEKVYILKSEYINHITRLSSPETTFYTASPLSQEEFSKLVNQIQKMSKNYQSNVHLLLSSFAVFNEKNEILNASLYVECGTGKVKVFSKAQQAKAMEIHYEGYSNYSRENPENHFISKNKAKFIAEVEENIAIVSHDTVFDVETYGKAKFVIGIDICFDYTNAHSCQQFLERLKANNDPFTFIPTQTDQILASNSMELDDETSHLSPHPLHVDARIRVIPEDHINKAHSTSLGGKSAKYSKRSISSIEETIIIENPSFGSDCYIASLKERQLETYVEEIKGQVTKANEKIMEKNIERYLNSQIPPPPSP